MNDIFQVYCVENLHELLYAGGGAKKQQFISKLNLNLAFPFINLRPAIQMENLKNIFGLVQAKQNFNKCKEMNKSCNDYNEVSVTAAHT